MTESHNLDKKSLRLVQGPTANLQDTANTCICFANAGGGKILIGIEDRDSSPPATQNINPQLPHQIQKRVSELTTNVSTSVKIIKAPNGGEYIELTIYDCPTVASTTDGRYFMRISDNCEPILPDGLSRLFTDKPSLGWEKRKDQRTHRANIDQDKAAIFHKQILSSPRVTDFVKKKSLDELLDYYLMADGESLTNLGYFS